MNIYTLHQEGSFRPPSVDCNSEKENNRSSRERNSRSNRLQVVTEEKTPHCSTSLTSGTSASGASSSLGEKTTPRHNTQNVRSSVSVHDTTGVSRATVSRIDATGAVITNTNPTYQVSSKSPSNMDPKANPKKAKNSNSTYQPPQLNKGKRNGPLIHIQAKDEFMIFEDDTDLVSHITTPSAVRTSPLETDYLEYDHEEFEEDQSLFSAITVPKALRKKKRKKKPKKDVSKHSTTDEEQKSGEVKSQEQKSEEKAPETKEQREIKLAQSTSTDETGDTAETQAQDEPTDLPPSPNSFSKRRQSSLDLVSSSHHSIKSSRGGRRKSKGTDQEEKSDQAEKPSTPPKPRDEINRASQDALEKVLLDIASPSSKSEVVNIASSSSQSEVVNIASSSSQSEVVCDEKKDGNSQQEERKKAPEQEMKKSPPPITETESVNTTPAKSVQPQEEDTSKPSPSIPKAEAVPSRPEASRPSQELKQGSGHRDNRKKSPTIPSTPEASRPPQELKKGNFHRENRRKSPKSDGIKSPSTSLTMKQLPDDVVKKVSEKSENANSDDYVAKAAATNGLDVTAQTVLDRTIHMSSEESIEFTKVPNSRRRKKTSKMWWLPTSCFCNQKKEGEQEQE